MQDPDPSLKERPSDKLAAFLRDCLLALVILAMVVWLIYVGVTAITTGHLDLGRGVRSSRRWFTGPVDGPPAVIAGVSFLCLAGVIGDRDGAQAFLQYCSGLLSLGCAHFNLTRSSPRAGTLGGRFIFYRCSLSLDFSRRASAFSLQPLLLIGNKRCMTRATS